MSGYPQIVQTVIDATDIRTTAEFYRELFGLTYRPGDEPPTDGSDDDAEWLVLRNEGGHNLAFQKVDRLEPTTWPEDDVPMQLHLDCTVPDSAELHRQRERAGSLGARLLLDRSEDPEEPLFVFADPAGHPFCIYVG
jgi:catechol 2,3-dioxygenase-like lactoylglutathione lyase family enzyme